MKPSIDWGIEQMNGVRCSFQQKEKKNKIKNGTKLCKSCLRRSHGRKKMCSNNKKTNHVLLPSQKLYHNWMNSSSELMSYRNCCPIYIKIRQQEQKCFSLTHFLLPPLSPVSITCRHMPPPLSTTHPLMRQNASRLFYASRICGAYKFWSSQEQQHFLDLSKDFLNERLKRFLFK